jgi:hypothetical protein
MVAVAGWELNKIAGPARRNSQFEISDWSS